ncbi:bifunctional diguanylate cyclase/phosphodiesterase [Actinoplanes sp. NPDC026623]|uniref:putative bifunctional diguanylate cyclase/phosphodiesterase n=1 Tax=Actinoplanes sp. NPDC026623 TaxID=3155610 RepID=UPI0033C8FC0E
MQSQYLRPKRRRLSSIVLVVVVAFTGTIASGVATRQAYVAEQRYAAQLMDRYAGDLSRTINTEIQRYGDTLSDVAIALEAQSELTAADFARIADKVGNRRRLPGATSLELVAGAHDGGVAALQGHWRRQGASDLKLKPVGNGEHAFTILTSSFDGVPVPAGRDLAAAPEAAEVLRDSQYTGALAVSRAYVLLKDRDLPEVRQQLSFRFAVPVYRIGGALSGWLTMGVHGGELLTESLQAQAHGAVTATLGDPEDALAQKIADFSGVTARDYPRALDRVAHIAAGPRAWTLEVRPTDQLLHETDRGVVRTRFAVTMTITLLLTVLTGLLANARNRAMGKVDAAAAALRGDIRLRRQVETRLRERELELEQMALHDPLTGLANRAGLDAHLADLVGRRPDVALLLIDLDDFKLVNDAHGYAAGDAMLGEFARILSAGIRPGDVAARIGGDEFVVLITDVPDEASALAIARRILAEAAATPVRLGDDAVTVRASIGVATGRDGDTPKELLRRADVAMYQAKRLGTHGAKGYDPTTTDQRAADAQLAEDLAGALGRDELHVLYQPLVDLTDGRALGVEALVRWQHPRLGLVSPVHFIPVAERTGVITEIGLFVLETACRQVTQWDDLYASVNLSPRQLQEPTLVQDVLGVLARTGLAPHRLVLEITESALVYESAGIAMLNELREHGIRVAIDDFGTGYSSLHYLTRLPVDILKIDRSFVAELNGTPEGAAIADAILQLSHVLHLTTIAEGIETQGQATELQLLGCNIGQGYLFAKPLPAPQLLELLAGPAPRLALALPPHVPQRPAARQSHRRPAISRGHGIAGVVALPRPGRRPAKTPYLRRATPRGGGLKTS